MKKKNKNSSNKNIYDIQFKFNPKTGKLVSKEERFNEIFGYKSKSELED